jgi:hypothetical protein
MILLDELGHFVAILVSRDFIIVMVLLDQVDQPNEYIKLLLVFEFRLLGRSQIDCFHLFCVVIMLRRLSSLSIGLADL